MFAAVADVAVADVVADVAAEVQRLVGQRVDVAADGAGYVIADVAGEGRPIVGVIERRDDALWLSPTDADDGAAAVRLSGPLAHPRVAGPGYKVWVLGTLDAAGALRAQRLGVLRPPR